MRLQERAHLWAHASHSAFLRLLIFFLTASTTIRIFISKRSTSYGCEICFSKSLSSIFILVFIINSKFYYIYIFFSKNLLIDLYKKQIWNDAKTVNVIASGCFTKNAKVISLALEFFAGKDTEKDSDDESDSDVITINFHMIIILAFLMFEYLKRKTTKHPNRSYWVYVLVKRLKRDKSEQIVL